MIKRQIVVVSKTTLTTRDNLPSFPITQITQGIHHKQESDTGAGNAALSKKYSVKEVALRLGYESWSYFGRQFKSVTGMSPMRFVMQNR